MCLRARPRLSCPAAAAPITLVLVRRLAVTVLGCGAVLACGVASSGGAAPPPSGGTSAPGSGAGTPVTAPSPPPPTPPSPPAAATLYRPVGCRARGARRALHDGPRRRAVAIGFDDGPWSDTAAFVSMLERAHAHATFFMIGGQVHAGDGPLLRRELRAGDELGNHSYTHPFLTRTGGSDGQLSRTQAAIRGASGFTPCVFRPPYGDYDGAVVDAAARQGLATVLWDVDPSDYALPGSAAIASRVLAQVHSGSIIISHDGGGPRGETLAAYPAIIASLHRRGYRVLSVSELLGFPTVYRRCRALCDGLGVPGPLPRGSIVER